MNILIINGSPKKQKSNTYKLSSAFAEGIKSNSHESISIKEINAYDLEIHPCSGCFDSHDDEICKNDSAHTIC